MNKVYLVFACSILEQDLMFIVYNIPTVGICRAEQRAKACQKLGISYSELGGVELFQQDNPLGLGQPIRTVNGSAAAMAAMQQQQQAAAAAAVAAAAQQQQQRKRGNSSQQAWDGSMMGADGLSGAQHHHRGDALLGLSSSEMNLAALAAGDVNMGMGMGLASMQVDSILPGLGNEAGMGMMGNLGAVMGSAAAAGMPGLSGAVGAAAGVTAEVSHA
jgi:hypothetical protein